jgi:hypothetical protein
VARRVASQFRPYRLQVGIVAGLVALTSGLGVVNPLLIAVVFDTALFVKGAPTSPACTCWCPSWPSSRSSPEPWA